MARFFEKLDESTGSPRPRPVAFCCRPGRVPVVLLPLVVGTLGASKEKPRCFTPRVRPLGRAKKVPSLQKLGGFYGDSLGDLWDLLGIYGMKLINITPEILDGWKMILSFWDPTYVQVRSVSFREGMIHWYPLRRRLLPSFEFGDASLKGFFSEDTLPKANMFPEA